MKNGKIYRFLFLIIVFAIAISISIAYLSYWFTSSKEQQELVASKLDSPSTLKTDKEVPALKPSDTAVMQYTLPAPQVSPKKTHLTINFPQKCGSRYRVYRKVANAEPGSYAFTPDFVLIGDLILFGRDEHCTITYRDYYLNFPNPSPQYEMSYQYALLDKDGEALEMSESSLPVKSPSKLGDDSVDPFFTACSPFSIPTDVVTQKASEQKTNVFRIVGDEQKLIGDIEYAIPPIVQPGRETPINEFVQQVFNEPSSRALQYMDYLAGGGPAEFHFWNRVAIFTTDNDISIFLPDSSFETYMKFRVDIAEQDVVDTALATFRGSGCD